MTELKSGNKTIKKQESKKTPPSTHHQSSSRKQKRKGETPIRILPVSDKLLDFGSSNSWICKNSACRAVISIEDSFCRRCSCCICHSFDENKDPSLWLVCSSETGDGDSCGLSCHIECALQHEKVGVLDLGQLMQLDGSYCCASCGKVSGILESWKKQIIIAKDARRVDVVCYRIYLSYRLLVGTSRFKELHEFVKEAKAKLETEVGPMDGVSAKMARGIVSRLPIAGDVQKLCSLAIESADQWLASATNGNSNCRAEGSLPAACRFFFEEVKTSSVIIILIELSASSSHDIKGYKLWYCKSREETPPKEPICVFPKTQRRILISNLQPCTEYTFRIVSYTESSDLGHSEAKCFTKSKEIIRKHPSSSVAADDGMKDENNNTNEGGSTWSAAARQQSKTPEEAGDVCGFRVRELGKIIRMAWAKQQGCSEGFCSAVNDKCCYDAAAANNMAKESETGVNRQLPTLTPRGLDLNVVSVPDLNEELTPPFESSRDDENNGCYSLEHGVEADGDDAASNDDIKKASLAGRSNGGGGGGGGESQTSNHDCDSTLINGGSPFCASGTTTLGSLDDNFESCVKIIRWLECEGHIDQEFRLKLLTWFSMRSTEQERRVVHTFIRTMVDDPSSLAEQLVDSFSDILSSKRARNGFCSKLWH
ncbi:VIN3-like protein 1 [Linum perenne]